MPVEEVLDELLVGLREQSSAVLGAPTGAGKTTRVPPALLDAGFGDVWVLEPRRLAARAAAQRMAEERGCPLGDEVGYRVRLDSKAGPRTRLCVATEGIFLRRLQSDPFLEGVGCVVFDEFHERGLFADLALAMVRRLQSELRPELKLVVMSATLDLERVAGYLEPCARVASAGRLHPVDVRYLPGLPREAPEAHLERGVREAFESTDGDLLAFLPGVGEIRRAEGHLEGWARSVDCALTPLYGDLPAEQQDRALRAGPGRRLVLATNVAETSVTVEGVTAVVDTGLARVPSFDAATGLDRLEKERIARDAADQRTGRAGRLRPGLGIRLWSEMDQRALAPRTLPELARVDLAPAALQILAWGEPDASAFPWLEAPPPRALDLALDTLRHLGALHARGVTSLGRELARLPLHPRLSLLMREGARHGVLDRAAKAAALLSERSPFRRARHPQPPADASDSDVLERVVALERFEAARTTDFPFGELVASRARYLLRVARQFERLVRGVDRVPDAMGEDEALLRALFAAFSDRLARRRERGGARAQMVGGRGVRLASSSGVTEPELFVCVEVAGGGRDDEVRLASTVERGWLDPERFEETDEVLFDRERERVVGRRSLRWNGLPLEEKEQPVADPAAGEALLVAEAAANLDRVVDRRAKDFAALLARWTCLREWVPELELPACDDALFERLLPSLAAGCRSFADLRRAPWLDSLRGSLSHAQTQALAREAPERLQIPTGDRLRLTYEPGRPPVLAARIQELFGMLETPRVARDRVQVLVHLLAPNGRPQQVTDDLDSFWRNTYPVVRKELRARYPRHAWPEDPFTARAERRPRRRK